MPTAFLLRFQESCVEDIAAAVCCGTKTETKVYGEQSDKDAFATPAVLPSVSEAGGTMTKTSVDRESEGRDQDRCKALMWAIPDSGTRTMVKRERPDDSSGEATSRVLPSPQTPPVAPPKTITAAVRAEADDNDLQRSNLRAVLKCS